MYEMYLGFGHNEIRKREEERKRYEKEFEKRLKKYVNKIAKTFRWPKKKKEKIFDFILRHGSLHILEETYEIIPSPFIEYYLKQKNGQCPVLLTSVVFKNYSERTWIKFYFDEYGDMVFKQEIAEKVKKYYEEYDKYNDFNIILG